ncbi:hypothetical protein EBZ39_18410 [bacterium]|nr:hypothetical protein [bacterium]
MDRTLTQVDELGVLIAQIKDLEAQAEAIKDQLKDIASAGGPKVFEGTLFKATYIEANRSNVDCSNVDWKALAAEFGIPADAIARHTKTTATFSIKTTSR